MGMIYIILAMLLYTVGILFGAAAARHSDTNVATAIINTMSAVIPLAVVATIATKRSLSSDKFGITMAILGGLTVGLFVMAINKAFSVNKLGIVTPVVFGGAIFLSTILSYFIFKEKITPLQGLGLALLAAGFIIITYARATAR